MPEHLSYKLSTSGSYPVWETPDASMPVTSANFTGTRTLNIFPDTGATRRTRSYFSPGAVAGSGSVSFRAYPTGLLPWLLRSIFTDASSTAAGAGWRNELLPDDTLVQLPWFSFQIQRVFGATVTENAKGCVVNSLTLSSAPGEEVNVSAEFTVEDTARTGGTWSDGTTSAPSAVTLAYPTNPDTGIIPAPLRFHEGTIRYNPTHTLAGKRLNVSGGTVLGTVESFNLAINLNTVGHYAIRQGAPTIAYTRQGERSIELTADIDWAAADTTYYEAMKAPGKIGMSITFASDETYSSGEVYELRINMPGMIQPEDSAPFPDIDGSLESKMLATRWIAMEETVSGTLQDIGVTMKTTDDLTP